MRKLSGSLRRAYIVLIFCIASVACSYAQNSVFVKGVVSSEKGNPIPAASVVARNLSTGISKTTITDTAGAFRFNNLIGAGVDDTYSFTVNAVGFKSKTLSGYKLKDGETTNIIVTLVEDSASLGDVVITGYQNIAKTRFSGSAIALNAEDVEVNGQVDVSRMLQGKAAGVSIQNVSGTFGSAPKIRIRGATSLSGDNKPLWVVDGVVLEDVVPISNDQLSSGDPVTLLGSSVAGLNANDIETFDILKDAAATALYGGRAMNGVIVITTKKGKAGSLKVAYTGNFTTALKPSYNSYDIMNSAQQLAAYDELASKGFLNIADIYNRSSWGVYGKMFQEINTYDPTTGTFELANTPEAKDAFLKRYATANTDWFDVLFKHQFVQEHNISFSSGTEKSKTFASVSYYGDNGWTIADKVDRLTLNINNNWTLNDRLSSGLTVRGSWRGQRAPGAYSRKSNPVNGSYDRDFDINPFSYALNTSRAITPYDENGNLEYFQMNYAPFNILNELQNNYMKINVLDIQAQGTVNYKIAKYVNYSFLGSVRMVNTNTEDIITENSNAAQAYRAAYNSLVAQANKYTYKDPSDPNALPVVVLPYGGFYNKSEVTLKSYNIRNSVVWQQTFNSLHYITLTGGQEIRSYDRQYFTSSGPGIQYGLGNVPDIDYRIYKMWIEQNNMPYSILPPDGSPIYERAASFYGDLQYSFNNKYNFEGSFRYDGGNRLGNSPTARWLPTGTVSASWNLDQEKFIKKIHQISSLKVRASYGLTGSLGAATNAAPVYTSQTTIRPYADEKETGITLSALGNKDLTWEKKTSLDLGVDASLFDKRIRLTADWYYNRSFNLIDLIHTSGVGGEYSKFANSADMVGKGFELSVNGDVIANKDWLWTLGLNFGTNYNKITKTTTLPSIWDVIKPAGGNVQGYPVFSLFAIDFQGLDGYTGLPSFINENGIVSNNVYFQASQFTDKDGNPVSIDKILKYQGPVTPPLTGGFNSNLKYKNFSLNVFVNFQQGNKLFLNPVFKNVYSDLDAFPKEFDDRWIMPGDELTTSVPSIMDETYYSRYGSTNLYNSYNYSTARVVKGDFIRLQTVTLQYTVSQKLTKKLKLSSLSLLGTANNVWLIYADSRLHGQDPEFFNSGGVASPVNKQYTFSLKIGF